MNEKIKVPTMKVSPLKKICMTIGQLPASYVETMSYYEMLVWFVHYLRNDIIPIVNANSEATQELQKLYVELQNYVNNYFDNLDVQEEINNKLDEMVKDGVLQEIITEYLNSKAVFGFDTINDLKAATNLIDGSYARTLGYYSINDDGDGLYKIIDDDTLVADNGSIIALTNGLYAKLITGDSINIKQFGAIEDGVTDDTQPFSNMINCANTNNIKTLILNNKNYKISSLLTFNSKNIEGNGATILFEGEASSDSYPIFFTGNDFYIRNLNIDLGETSFYAASARLQNSNNVVFENGYYSHAIDIYTKNKNVILKNIKNGHGVTCRELFANTTENITFENCIIDRPSSADECCWVVSSHGIIRNVLFNNCIFINQGGSENGLAVSAYYEGSLTENVIFNNCKFEFKNMGYYCMHINGSSQQIKGTTKNVIFKNCNIDLSVNNDNRFILRNESTNDTCIFDNCNINVEKSDYNGFISVTLKNCNINVKSKIPFLRCLIDNSTVEALECDYLTAGGCKIENSSINTSGLINIINTNTYGAQNNTNISNCIITSSSSTLFQVNGNYGNITLENSKLIYPTGANVFTANSVTEDCNMLVKNCDFSEGYKKLGNYNSRIKIEVINLLSNGKTVTTNISDIDQNTRRSLNLNTLIMAPSNVGLYYRKTSEGSEPSNWTIIDGI